MLTILSTTSHAHQYRNAENLFVNRAHGRDTIHRAKEMYVGIIKDTNEILSLRKAALDRYARLALYEGEIAKKSLGVKNSAEIFNECIDVTHYLSPSEIHETSAEYTYWRAVCIGLWGSSAKARQVAFHIGRVKELKDLVAIGMDQFRSYDGFGFDRILAGMFVRSKSLSMLNLYHPEKALSHVDESIQRGTDNYIDYLIKADALIALKRKAEAKTVLSAGILELQQKLERGSVPYHLSEENHFFMYQMKKMLEKLEG